MTTRIDFYTFSDLKKFIDESINLPIEIVANSSEILPISPHVSPFLIVIYDYNISLSRLLYQFIRVDIKRIKNQ